MHALRLTRIQLYLIVKFLAFIFTFVLAGGGGPHFWGLCFPRVPGLFGLFGRIGLFRSLCITCDRGVKFGTTGEGIGLGEARSDLRFGLGEARSDLRFGFSSFCCPTVHLL